MGWWELNGRRGLGWGILALALAGAAAAEGQATAAAPGGLDDMRAWLARRNQERKALGLAVPETPRHRPPAPGHALPQAVAPAPPRENLAGLPKPPPDPGRGPDGRIHHRLLLNEDGPDQLQVYAGSGYAPAAPEAEAKADEAHWAKLTPRGRRSWLAGLALRGPASARTRLAERK